MKRAREPSKVTMSARSLKGARLSAWHILAVLESDKMRVSMPATARADLIRKARGIIRLTTPAPTGSERKTQVSELQRAMVEGAITQAGIAATPAALDKYLGQLDLPHTPDRRQIRRILAKLRGEHALD